MGEVVTIAGGGMLEVPDPLHLKARNVSDARIEVEIKYTPVGGLKV